MLTRSLLQCRACRLTWFPQGGAGAGCPACGGTKFGGTLELFHAGIALILLGLIGLFLRHGPLGDNPAAPVPAIAQTKVAAVGAERAPAPAPAVKERRTRQVYVSSLKTKSTKVKASKFKRPKKATKRSKHVQR